MQVPRGFFGLNVRVADLTEHSGCHDDHFYCCVRGGTWCALLLNVVAAQYSSGTTSKLCCSMASDISSLRKFSPYFP